MKIRMPRLRFSIATMMLIMTMAAIWIAQVSQQASQQRKVATWVSRVGGYVRYDWQPNDRDRPGAPASPPAPRWCIDLLGPDYFQSIRAIGVGDPALDDILPLASQTSLVSLSVSSQYCSYDLAPLQNLKQLERLTLHAKEIDDLTPLYGLPRLQQLEIRDTIVDQSVLDAFAAARPDVTLETTPATSERTLSPNSRLVRDWE